MKGTAGIPATIVAFVVLAGSAAAQQPDGDLPAACPAPNASDRGFTTAIFEAWSDDGPARALPLQRFDAQTGLHAPYLPYGEANPIGREPFRNRLVLEQRRDGRTSVIARPRTAAPDANRTAGLWRISIGNTSMENWSPYPDRALDARVLRFPHPRELRRDKRPLHVQRMERLNKTNK